LSQDVMTSNGIRSSSSRDSLIFISVVVRHVRLFVTKKIERTSDKVERSFDFVEGVEFDFVASV